MLKNYLYILDEKMEFDPNSNAFVRVWREMVTLMQQTPQDGGESLLHPYKTKAV